jgi:hypothetical protein
MVIALSNGICYDPIILGSIPNSKVNEYVNLDNAHTTGTSTDGGLGLNFHRKRLGNDYGNVTFNAINKPEQESKVELGGINEIDPETQEEVAHRGIRVQSTALAKFVTANNVTKEVGGNTYQFHFHQATDDSPLNTINEKGNVELYHIAYWTQPLASNQADEARPYVSRLQVSHLPSPGQLQSQGNKRLQTQINWLTQPQSAKPQFASIEITPKSDASKKETLPLSPSQRSIQITTTAGEEYDVVIQSSYPVAQDDEGNQQPNYVDQIKFSFISSLAIEQVTLSNIKPMLDPKTQWQANLSWQLGGDYGKDLQSYQLNSSQIGSASLSQTSVPIDELEGQTPYDVNIQAQLTTGADQEVDFSFELAKLTDEAAQQQAPEIGFERTADKDGITDTHNLKTKYLFVSDAQQRIPNPPEGHAHDFEQKALGLETFLSHTQVEFIQSESKYNYALDPNYDEIEKNAKDRALETKSKLIRTHKGNSTIDHQGTVDIDTQSNSYSKTYQAKEVKYSNELGYHLSREGISFNYQGTDLVYYAPFATRTIKNATYSAGKQFIINASYIGIKTDDAEIECEEYETGVQLGISKGDQVIKCQTANFGDGLPSMSMNFKLPELTSAETPAAGTVDEGEQTETKEVINAGLQTLKVVPKWRKTTASMIDPKSFLGLSRASLDVQQEILDSISLLYQSDSAEQDKFIEVPKTADNWAELIKKGYDNKVKALDSEIQQIQSEIQTINQAMPSLRGQNSDYAVDQINDLQSTKAEKEQQKSLYTNSEIQKIIDDYIERVNEDCTPANAPDMRAGYLYVFLQDSQVEDNQKFIFAKTHTYKEYKITVTDGVTNYTEVLLASEAGLDDRDAKGDSDSCIELPAAYVKSDTKNPNDTNNVKPLDQVIVLYSHTQLSWARLHYYGGLDKQDSRFIAANEIPDNQKLLNAVKEQDLSLIEKRGDVQDAGNLLDLWQKKVLNQSVVDQSVHDNSAHNLWDNPIGYAVEEATSIDPFILVSDYVGLVFEQVNLILYCQKQIKTIVSSLEKNIDMRTALLAWQTFFNPKAMGLVQVSGLDPAMYNIKGLPDTFQQQWSLLKERYTAINKGTDDLDKSKLELALKRHSRQFFKLLMHSFQQTALTLLQQPKFKEVWQDHFSVGVLNYISAHSEFWGIIQPLCIDPNALDQDIEPGVLPLDEIKIKVSTNLAIMPGYDGKGNANYEGYTHTQYKLYGYHIEKTVTEYGKETDDTTGMPKITSQNTTEEKTLSEPVGYQFLEEKVFEQGSDLGQMLLPDATDPDFTKTIDQNDAYLKAQGKYNGTLLGQGHDYLAELLDEQDAKDSKQANALGKSLEDSADKFKEAMKDKLKEQAISSIHHFLDSAISTLQKKPYTTYSKIIPSLQNMICDAYQQDRKTLTIQASQPDPKAITLTQAVITDKKRNYLSEAKTMGAQLQSQDHIFKMTDGHYEMGYANAEKALKVEINKTNYALEQIKQDPKVAITYVSGQSEYIQSYKVKTEHNELDRESIRRFKAFDMLVTQSIFSVYTAYQDFNSAKEAIANAKKKDDGLLDIAIASTHTAISICTALCSALEASHHLAKNIALLNGTQAEYSDFLKHAGFVEIDDKLKNIKMARNAEFTKLKYNVTGQYRDVLGNISALTYLSILSSSLDVIQSAVSWIKAEGQNDPAVAASNFLDMISKGFYAASGINVALKQAAGKEVGNIINKTVIDVMDTGLKKGSKIAAETAVKTIQTRVALSVAGELIGAFIPVVDILSFIAFAAQMGSLLALYFRDNIYQGWAKASQYAQGSYQTKFTGNEEYAALLNMIALPHLEFNYDSKKDTLSSKTILPNVNLDSPDIYYQVNIVASPALKDRALSDGRIALKRYRVAYPVNIESNQIYDTNTKGLVGLELDMTDQNIKEMICGCVLSFALWLQKNSPETYPTQEEALFAATRAFSDYEESFWRTIFNTSKCFGLYAATRISEGDVAIPNKLISKVADITPTQEETDFDKLVLGDQAYIHQWTMTDVFNSPKELEAAAKAYAETNQSINPIKVETVN